MGWRDTIQMGESAPKQPSWRDTIQTPKPEMGWGEYLGRGAIDAVPVATGLLGGTVSAPLGPVAAVGGGALGYAGGKELQGLLKHYAFGDELPSSTPMDQATRVAGNLKEGVEQEVTGMGIGAGLGLLGKAATGGVRSLIPKSAPRAVTPAKGLMTEAAPEVASGLRAATPEEFVLARDKGTRGAWLTPYAPDEIKAKGFKTFMADEGVGYALTPDGDLVNVFNNSTRKGAGQDAVVHAISQGAKTLDALDGFLPDYYSKFGFKLTKRVKWDDNYAPQGWDYAKQGRPDIVYMEYPGSLSREPGEVAARFRAARSGEPGAASGIQRPGNDTARAAKLRASDSGTRRGMDAPASQPPAVTARADSKNVKRNIVVRPILTELAEYKSSLHPTRNKQAVEQIDGLISEIKKINKYGKVSADELGAIKERLNSLAAGSDPGSYLRRAAILAKDTAEGIQVPGPQRRVGNLAGELGKKAVKYATAHLFGVPYEVAPIVVEGAEYAFRKGAPVAKKGLLKGMGAAGTPAGQKAITGLLRANDDE